MSLRASDYLPKALHQAFAHLPETVPRPVIQNAGNRIVYRRTADRQNELSVLPDHIGERGAVTYGLINNERPNTIDVDTWNLSGNALYEIECIGFPAPNLDFEDAFRDQNDNTSGAQKMADLILDQLARDGALVTVEAQYDEDFDRSQYAMSERSTGELIIHVIVVLIPGSGLPEVLSERPAS